MSPATCTISKEMMCHLITSGRELISPPPLPRMLHQSHFKLLNKLYTFFSVFRSRAVFFLICTSNQLLDRFVIEKQIFFTFTLQWIKPKFEEAALQPKYYVKYLGILLNSKLSWRLNVVERAKKASTDLYNKHPKEYWVAPETFQQPFVYFLRLLSQNFCRELCYDGELRNIHIWNSRCSILHEALI